MIQIISDIFPILPVLDITKYCYEIANGISRILFIRLTFKTVFENILSTETALLEINSDIHEHIDVKM